MLTGTCVALMHRSGVVSCSICSRQDNAGQICGDVDDLAGYLCLKYGNIRQLMFTCSFAMSTCSRQLLD